MKGDDATAGIAIRDSDAVIGTIGPGAAGCPAPQITVVARRKDKAAVLQADCDGIRERRRMTPCRGRVRLRNAGPAPRRVQVEDFTADARKGSEVPVTAAG